MATPNLALGSLGFGGIGADAAIANRYSKSPAGFASVTCRVLSSTAFIPEIVFAFPEE